MEDEQFEWDDDKAARNWRVHAVTFEMARDVFRDPFAIEWQDDERDPNEQRYGIIGMVEGRLLFVGYAMRRGRIRIITARKAEPYERRTYHEENREP
ncbi:MAG TPA: BrnT family toxin [Stellaceae bacterium]|nr:BrnT family toxin [Stellaceae bacterium]